MADSQVPTGEVKNQDSTVVRVADQNGEVVQFRVRNTAPFKKMFNAYCDKKGLDIKNLRFMFDGTRVQPTDTPTSINLEDNDVIEVFSEQTGGE